ncbi:MAG: acyl-CoA dehydrogenase [Chloroflexi bacterium]|mgnify:FL=1|jgi:acyl-CoA dehydrogenase|nr:acyl-CoA dehydrogenase [Chloroflexota bacterium]
MYSFKPSEEQQMLIDALKRYAMDDLRAAARDAEEEGHLPVDLVEKGWELGYLQASIPEDYDGFGERSAVTGALAVEELAYGDLAGALAVMTPGLFATPILLAGSEAQKKAYIPPVIEMEWKPFTAALMEQKFDFDPNDLATTAAIDGDSVVINGEKSYVPYADGAEAMLVYANLAGTTQGFIVPAGTEGVVVGERQKLLGLNALPFYTVRFANVSVPLENRLGGSGGHDFAPILAASNVALAAMAIGVSNAALDYAVEYAKDRDVFGMKVAQKQAIAFMIAEMGTAIEAIRLLVWEAAWMIDGGNPEANKQAYLALSGAMDTAMMVTDRAVQILGGHGYIREHPVEMWMRSGRGFATFNGLAIV